MSRGSDPGATPARSWVARAAAVAVAAGLMTGFGNSPAQADADVSGVDGSSQLNAAGSCWEIKQKFPSKPSGLYWLQTPSLPAPMKVYCDQTTDGGGWALVARGRERWTEAGGGTVGAGDWMTSLPLDGAKGTMIAKQLPATDIDGLLNKSRVDSLQDGVRLRRATNTAGSSWQEVRVKFAQRDRWSWAWGANHPISSYSVDGRTDSRTQYSKDLRIGDSDGISRTRFVDTSSTDWVRGFKFGVNGPKGDTSAESYLYSERADGAFAAPFTQMYIRPRLMRDQMNFPKVPDTGTAPITNRPVASSQALPNTWGVTGLGAGGKDFRATEVSSFLQVGNVMYVGGNFTTVRNNVTGKTYAQPYLAAFDATTGEWISKFRPRLNNQVKALALYDGRLVVGGQFTQVSGKTRRALVIMSRFTGLPHSKFTTDFTSTIPGAPLEVRSLEVVKTRIYVGGGFTHVRGGTTTKPVARRNITRLNGANGSPDQWAPNLGRGLKSSAGHESKRSSVLDLSMSPDRKTLYAAGQFTKSYMGDDGLLESPHRGTAAITTGPKATVKSWQAVFTSTKSASQYQQTVLAVGDKVWLGGSQHSIQQYEASDLSLKRSHLTRIGGDAQALASKNGIVYASCHCNNWMYSDNRDYDKAIVDDIAFTQADRIGYVGAWDAVTGDFLPEFAPTVQTRAGEGPWAIATATNGTVWAGGDLTGAVTTDGSMGWAGGFVRFPPTPSTAPEPPSGLTMVRDGNGGNSGHLEWKASATAGVQYELIRNDRVIETMAAGDLTSDSVNYFLNSRSSRFFVRAVDGSGNRSASTPVLTAGGSSPSSSPTGGSRKDVVHEQGTQQDGTEDDPARTEESTPRGEPSDDPTPSPSQSPAP